MLVAVYGSLREGMHNHRDYLKVDKADFLGIWETDPIFTLYDLGSFPGLKKFGLDTVVLEIYDVYNAEDLEAIDGLEGYHEDNPSHSMYIRETIETPFGEAYIYFFNQSVIGKTIVEGGDWKEHYSAEKYASHAL